MTTSQEINGLKCLNQRHFIDAEATVGKPAPHANTMTAFYDKGDESVVLMCLWCDYHVHVDVSNHPLQVTGIDGGTITIGPTIK